MIGQPQKNQLKNPAKKQSHNAAHNKLVSDALFELAQRGYTAYKNETGVWFEQENGERGRPHKYGKKGSADIVAIVPRKVFVSTLIGEPVKTIIGQHCEFEAKTGTGRQSENQIRHQKYVVERNGGVYILFRTVEDLFSQMKAYGL